LVRATMLGPTQGPNSTSDTRMHIRTRARNHPRTERRGVELMLGVQDQRRVHGTYPGRRGVPPVQEMQEMPTDRVILGVYIDALRIVAVVIPVAQHRAERSDQLIGNVPGAGSIVIILFRQ